MKTELEEVWEEFFWSGLYGDFWSFQIDPQRTQEEVDGVLSLLNPTPGSHILDWCGGWGRHSIELAKRGFRVTLLDFAPNHIQMAREVAKAAGVSLDFVCADFRKTPSTIQADFAVNLFTAGLGCLTEEDDAQALRSLYAALKPGALFLLDTISLFWLVKNYQPRGWDEDEDRSRRRFETREFDFWTNRNRAQAFFWEKGKKEKESEIDLRIYSPAELAAVLRRAGFEPVELFGDFDGQEFGFDSRRLIMISRRS